MSKSYIVCNHTAIHNGNQFKKVTDQCDELTYAGAMDFKYGASEQVEYTWDANGNMTSDLNKGLTEIKYNILNLPEKITHNDGHITYITYAADGRKLRVTYKIDPTATIEPGEPFLPHGSISPLWQQVMANGLDGGDIQHPIDDPVAMDVIMTRDYCGNYTYRNGSIERIMMGNGFMQDSTYYVQIKDYQGNVRAVLDQNRNLVERNEYYPYGGLINASDTQLQPYKYSSKELDRENGLDLYDSQARWYDPMLPQTTTLDPLAEKYYSISPYTWCAGNPVRFVDDEGTIVRDNNENIIFNIVNEDDIWIQNIDKNNRVTFYFASKGRILTDAGEEIEAYKARSSTIYEGFLFDSEIINVTPLKGAFDNSYNCTGNALADRQLNISSDLITPQILEDEGYFKLGDNDVAKSGDIGIYVNNKGMITHFEPFITNTLVSSKGGIAVDAGLVSPGVNQWFIGDAYFIIRKTTPNTIVGMPFGAKSTIIGGLNVVDTETFNEIKNSLRK